jgi:mannose-1-phosphate guanylyltransferase/mannose-6-phosphate isomerase
MKPKLIPVIISGGSSTRSFPLSRSNFPKPFLTLVGNSTDGTLFYNTLQRCLMFNPSEIYTVTLQNLYDLTAEEVAKLPKKDYEKIKMHYILENKGFDTAPAFTLPIIDAYHNNPDNILLILPSDHVIKNNESFYKQVNKAKKLAKDGSIVIFGITPDKPDVGFGYIKKGSSFSDPRLTANLVDSFKEKPDIDTAKEYVESGNYLWNSGMVCAKASVLYEELKQYSPTLLQDVISVYDESYRSPNSIVVNYKDDFAHKLPFDIALLEKTQKLVVISCNDLEWSDVGSWDSVANHHLSSKTDSNVIINGSDTQIVHTMKSAGNYINNSASKKKVISLIGINNLIIVNTDDTLLIMAPGHSADVKAIVNDLKLRNCEVVDNHMSTDIDRRVICKM